MQRRGDPRPPPTSSLRPDDRRELREHMDEFGSGVEGGGKGDP